MEPLNIGRSEMPRHIAVVMDGNGRWAKQRGLPRLAGHRQGVERVREIVTICGHHGISYLTLFAFSRENWHRPPDEVRFLIQLLQFSLEKEKNDLHSRNVRLRVIGDLSRFPDSLQQSVLDTIELTSNNLSLNLTIAINYGGQWDIMNACQSVADSVRKGEVALSDLTPAIFASHLCTSELPEPDFFIRTGGEIRISNFLLWQLAYTELYFTDAYWPDFDEHCFNKALEAFAQRQRRFGMIESQIKECI